MAYFRPVQTTEDKLPQIEVVDGQIIVCTDSGFLYRDTKDGRIRVGTEIEIVDELPGAPINLHFYYSKADRDLFFYDDGWANVSENELQVLGGGNSVGVTLAILENGNKKSEIPIKGSGITSVFKASDGSIQIKTKEPDIITNLEIDKLLSM